MTLVLSIAAGYLLGRFAAFTLSTLAASVGRQLGLRTRWYRRLLAHDSALDGELRRRMQQP